MDRRLDRVERIRRLDCGNTKGYGWDGGLKKEKFLVFSLDLMELMG
jgi:hypothetical protein